MSLVEVKESSIRYASLSESVRESDCDFELDLLLPASLVTEIESEMRLSAVELLPKLCVLALDLPMLNATELLLASVFVFVFDRPNVLVNWLFQFCSSVAENDSDWPDDFDFEFVLVKEFELDTVSDVLPELVLLFELESDCEFDELAEP